MKKLAVLFFVFAMSATTTFANNDKDKGKGEVLRTQIVKYLGKYDTNENIKAEVTFMLNRKNEIIVLSVEAENKEIVGFIKSKLNYKKIQQTTGETMEVYKVPVRFVKA